MSKGKKILIAIIAVVVVAICVFGGIILYHIVTAEDYQKKINDGAFDVAVSAQTYMELLESDSSLEKPEGSKIYGKIEENASGEVKCLADQINKDLGSEHNGEYYAVVFYEDELKLAYSLFNYTEITDTTFYNNNMDDQLSILKDFTVRGNMAGIYIIDEDLK